MNIRMFSPAKTDLRGLFVGIVTLAVGGCLGGGGREPEPPVAVRVAKPVLKDLRETVSYMGAVRGRREIRLTAQIQGTVRALPREEGEAVKKGELVAELYAPELEAAVSRLRADRDY